MNEENLYTLSANPNYADPEQSTFLLIIVFCRYSMQWLYGGLLTIGWVIMICGTASTFQRY